MHFNDLTCVQEEGMLFIDWVYIAVKYDLWVFSLMIDSWTRAFWNYTSHICFWVFVGGFKCIISFYVCDSIGNPYWVFIIVYFICMSHTISFAY